MIIRRWVDGLARTPDVIYLKHGHQTLTIMQGGRGRVVVTLRDPYCQIKHLVDSLATSRRPQTVKLRHRDGQVDRVPYHQTVTTHTAVDVAAYFAETGDIPPGLNWVQ